MKKTGHRTADRVENLISSIDAYEPQKVREHEDLFRVFARFMSRSLDGRYLERHPPQELLPDIEELMSTMLVRQPDEIKIKITMNEGDAKRGVLTLAMPDQFFIFSTVTQGLENMSVEHHRYLNSAVQIKRSATGTITSVSTGDATPEVFIWLEIEGDDLKNRTDEVITHLQARLEATQAAVEDFPAMESLVVSLADHFDDMAKKRPDHRELHSDNARLLRWMMDHHFVLLGIKVLKMTKETPMLRVADLGVGRLDDWRGIQLDEAESAVRDTGGIAPFLWIRKSNTEAWTYRPGRMDHVLVQCFDKDGSPAGILVIEGLFSYNALSDPCAEIPILDRIVDRLYTQWSAERGSHLYRAIRNAFNSLPLEYLFPLEFDDIQQLVERALHGEQDQTLQTHITTDEAQNTAFVFVSLPRTNYSDELRMDIRRLLMQTFKASSIDDGVFARGDDAVYIHFFLIGASTLTAKETDQMQDTIAQLAKPWHTRFKDALTDRYGKEESEKHHDAYSEAFPASYREGTSVARAATDIEYLDGLSAATPFDCDVYREKADKHLELSRLRMFHNTTTQLSDIMPILDNFGLVVQDQSQTPVRMPGTSESIINTFRVSAVRGMDIDLTTRRNRLRAGIRAVVSGAMSNDSYNQLLLRADVPWNYVALIRAYENYSRQIGIGFGPNTILDVMLRHSNVVRALTELFRAKFDPDMEGLSATEVDSKREEIIDRTRRALLTQIEGISDLTSDQILRFFHNLVESTVRTNFYARDPWEKYRIVVKFDPAKIDRLPFPRPFREIYVHHPKVAGVHLRGGPVARGGIRWSDRPSDYRTEILGLVHTQNLKNVVIVPKGSKGGFILRNPPADMGERRAAADHYYK
ncbi:NAD-glutamate dehydrogenase, partial [Myxococcota bacterium]|nr:NAD-glutamate dehydrogenase [Myxococcota bacterium]